MYMMKKILEPKKKDKFILITIPLSSSDKAQIRPRVCGVSPERRKKVLAVSFEGSIPHN